MTARAVCGCTPPNLPPQPRDPLTIAQDLAEDFASGMFDDCALSSADALLVGCGRLVIELRQRQGAQS
jgi:hypothetical protein